MKNPFVPIRAMRAAISVSCRAGVGRRRAHLPISLILFSGCNANHSAQNHESFPFRMSAFSFVCHPLVPVSRAQFRVLPD